MLLNQSLQILMFWDTEKSHYENHRTLANEFYTYLNCFTEAFINEEKEVAKLNAKKRDGLKDSEFGLPKSRKYPVDTKARAANAKARATQQVKKGKLSESSKKKIDTKANKVLKKRK